MKYQERGFTLIELMISLALGLLIVAASTILFLSSQRSLALQQATSDIQDNSNFALNYITKQIRIANLAGKDELPLINLNSSNSGVVFNTNNLANVSENLVTQTGVGLSTTQPNSDQLTIQYKPMVQDGFDCEGRKFPDNYNGYIVERYFIRSDSRRLDNEPNSLALACKAGYSTDPSSLNGDGQIIIKRADYFRVLLILKNTKNNTLEEISANKYTKSEQGEIVGLRLAILARATQRTQASTLLPSNFSVLDTDINLTQDQVSNYLREVITQTIALRNKGGDD